MPVVVGPDPSGFRVRWEDLLTASAAPPNWVAEVAALVRQADDSMRAAEDALAQTRDRPGYPEAAAEIGVEAAKWRDVRNKYVDVVVGIETGGCPPGAQEFQGRCFVPGRGYVERIPGTSQENLDKYKQFVAALTAGPLGARTLAEGRLHEESPGGDTVPKPISRGHPWIPWAIGGLIIIGVVGGGIVLWKHRRKQT